MIEIIPNWHPIFVHFSVGLLSISVVLFILSKFVTHWRLEDQWLATAYWTLWIGVLITVGTVIAGWYAMNTVKHDDPSHLVMLDHRLWALVTAGIFAVAAIWGIVQYKAQSRPGAAFLVLMVVGLVGLGGTAWRGGELVFRHGVGVMALPNPSNHAHAAGTPAHSHGEEAAAGHHDDLGADGGHHADTAQSHGEMSPEAQAQGEGAVGAEAAVTDSPAPAVVDHHDDGHAH